MRSICLLGLLSVLLLAPPARAQDPSPSAPEAPGASGRALTLEQALELGARQNPGLQAAREAVVAAGARHEQARSRKNTTLRLVNQTALQPPRSLQVPGLGRFPLLDTLSTQIQLSLETLLTTFGDVENQIAASFLQVGVEERNAQVSGRELAFQIKQAFFDLLRSQAGVAVAREALEVAGQSLADAEKLFRQGVSARYDVVQAQLQQTEASEQLARAESAVRLARAALLTLLHEPIGGALDPTQPEPAAVDPQVTVEHLGEVALLHRPELLGLEQDLRVAGALREAARSGGRPTLSLSADYLTALGNSLVPRDRYQLALNLGWSLWDGGLSQAATEEAEARIRGIERSGELLRGQVRLQVEQAWLTFELTGATLETARLRVEAAGTYHAMARQRFLNGLGTSLEVQDALRRLNEARQQEVAARFDREEAFAGLEQACGVDFPGRRLSLGVGGMPVGTAPPGPAAPER